ncbi:probable nucleolar protein 5-1 isoform X2 [Aegilops tauschii subsp. strangulata]|uniref:probable nucleolar protein 5-1 isoform X2 n=1 Tax=Aegilops tauschii subsp. strangulata TaxID=200361 RepID=UPI00098B612A|nr:probable nucleolar protein 5-1 [Aegilops tauschii subsp. strangulata]
MGQRARRKRARRRPAPPRPAPAASPPPPPGTPYADICRWLGQSGVILVLFETPSGFAVLHYDGVKLFRRNALEDIWSEFIDMPWARMAVSFKEFQIFEDKARAINSDGVCSELAEMIKRSLWPGQKLAVGKQEYKDIIEASLGIHCLFDEAVLEVMWGLKNLIKMLVPDEKLELTNEDRLQIR